MSNTGPDDPPKSGPQSERARNLFGHKGGAKPWDAPEAKAASNPAPTRPDNAASVPYPRDAQYTPRPDAMEQAGAELAPELAHELESQGPASDIFTDVDDDGELTKLHPNYKLMMRVGAIISGLVLMVIAIVVEGILRSEIGLPYGVIMGPVLLLALFFIIRVPSARFNARGYQISHDRLRVVRGIMWHSDTIVPFGRVQHIDVDQGPIERALGIATITLHTAGSHNASVHLPGLGHELAIEMREAIRAHIKREGM